MIDRTRPGIGLANALAIVALMVFAFWAPKHVGESFFLADQVDQLQKFESLLRLEPEGLWGPAMSGTQARALGPFGAIMFGIPLALGLGINSIHAMTSLLLVAATTVAFFQLTRVSQVLAWTWLIVFTEMRIVWWNAAMFWVNTLLLPLGLLLLAMSVACLRKPSVPRLAGLVLLLMLALQQHLIALVAVPLIALIGVATWRDAVQRPPSRPAIAGLVALAAVVMLPYLLAEARTGARNTRAILGHVNTDVHPGNADGRNAAVETLLLAADPMVLLPPDKTSEALTAGAALAAAALLVLVFRLRQAVQEDERRDLGHTLWLAAAAIVGVAGQALFYFVMARPLNGLHYVTLLAPWYAIPPAALAAGLIPARRPPIARIAPIALGSAAVLLLIVRAPELADRYAELSPWNYGAITSALETLCAGEAVRTVEGPGLVDDLTPGYDSVLRYLMRRGYTTCRYDPDADIVILANRSRDFGDVLLQGDARFRRERVLPPGIARYRRVR